MAKLVLVVDKEDKERKHLKLLLDSEQMESCFAGTVQEALEILATEPVDMVLTELDLPDMDGRLLVQRIREYSWMPVLVVSARKDGADIADLLDDGADDYICKPWSQKEVRARIRLAFRHLHQYGGSPRMEHVRKLNGLELDMLRQRAWLDGSPVHLTPLEYKFLALLLQYPGKVLPTPSILRELYGYAYDGDTQALRSLVAGTRKKLKDSAKEPKYIVTEMGIGYRSADANSHNPAT